MAWCTRQAGGQAALLLHGSQEDRLEQAPLYPQVPSPVSPEQWLDEGDGLGWTPLQSSCTQPRQLLCPPDAAATSQQRLGVVGREGGEREGRQGGGHAACCHMQAPLPALFLGASGSAGWSSKGWGGARGHTRNSKVWGGPAGLDAGGAGGPQSWIQGVEGGPWSWRKGMSGMWGAAHRAGSDPVALWGTGGTALHPCPPQSFMMGNLLVINIPQTPDTY